MRVAERIRYLALAVQREGNRQLSAELRPLGVTPAQSEALRIIADHEPMTLTDVGRMLVCESGTNPSRIIDKLVDSGLVDRVVDAVDRRRVTLRLTAAGRECERAIRVVEDRMYDQLDAAFAHVDTAVLIGQLESLVHGRPSGLALAARIAGEAG
jgi:DNA-binding MarR family transcriptional regulator